MSTTILNVRVDKKDKYKADQIVKDLGLTLSSAVNSFLKALIRNNGIPYEMKADKPNKETERAIKQSLKHNPNRTCNSVEELKVALGV